MSICDFANTKSMLQQRKNNNDHEILKVELIGVFLVMNGAYFRFDYKSKNLFNFQKFLLTSIYSLFR